MNFAQFQKPQRYIGNEWNVVKKDHAGRIKICLSYPDTYEIGMSNLGLRIIYSLLNDFDDVVCERVFLPDDDFAAFFRNSQAPLFSLETKTALKDFEVIGFNLSCELNLTNFLDILSLGGIPLLAAEREKVIIVGGGIANPEPVADFVDVFFMGEFEDSAAAFVEVLRKVKDKEERLKALAQIDGFYVPKFYAAGFNGAKYSFEKKYAAANFPIRRMFVKDFNNAPHPDKWLVPYGQIVHDRVQVEIARGCPNACVFCQARAVYRPYRERSIPAIMDILRKSYENSGYEEFTLLALSVSNYSHIEELIDESIDYFKDRKVGLSLPSLRVDDILGRLHSKLSSIKNSSLTVAVEAARDCLRDKLNKKIDLAKLFEAGQILRALKIRKAKLYFMFGFSDETDEDLAAIGKFLHELSYKTRLNLNVSINVFVPKPFSLWEGEKMDSEETLLNKRQIILNHAPAVRYIDISISSIKKSIFEGIVSRADRSFSRVLLNAYRKGARRDSSSERFNWDIWEAAMKEEGFDWHFCLEAKTENHPWNIIE